MNFEFATAARIVFGAGKVAEVAPAASHCGRHVLLVTGGSTDRAARLRSDLAAQSLACTPFTVDGEPTIAMVRNGVELARRESCDVVISFGGGSAIDAGKGIAAILGNGGDPLDYLEVVGKGQKLTRPSVPFIAVPTTAGTGSEVTRNAVLGAPDHGVKASLRSPLMLPRLAVVDPDLTLDLPPALTASTGLDALTQLIEPYVSSRANPCTDIFCLEGIRRAAASLERVFTHPHDRAARADMALASLLGGLSLANAGLGAVHGFAAPIGGMFPAPHGAVCAALLPHVMEMNLRHPQVHDRFRTVARTLTGNPDASPADGLAWVRRIGCTLEIPPLRTYGIREEHTPALIQKASNASSMKANPIRLTAEELAEVLARAR